jgi:tetratricopeptide (TPR) repeat protein
LAPTAARDLLRGKGIQGSEAELLDFADLTSGHPLLLELIAGQLWDKYGDAPPLSGWQRLNPDLFAYMGAHRGDPEASLGKVFAASYQRLSPEQQQLLRYLSVYRPRFDGRMAIAMADSAPTDPRAFEKTVLRYWVRLALLQEQPPQAGSPRLYFLVPLIRRYLQHQGDLTPAHERATAFYTSVCKPQLTRDDGQTEVATYLELAYHLCQLQHYADAVNLLQSNTDGNDPYSSCLKVIQFRGQQATLLPIYQAITRRWQPQNDQEKRRYGDTLKAQGDVLQFLDQRSEALANYDAALTIYREVGARLGEANTLKAQAFICQSSGQLRDALSLFRQALEIYQGIGDRYSEGMTLQAMAPVYQQLGQVRESFACGVRSSELLQDIELPLEAMPYPNWLKRMIRFAQKGKLYLFLCLAAGIMAFPVILILILAILAFRLLRAPFRK